MKLFGITIQNRYRIGELIDSGPVKDLYSAVDSLGESRNVEVTVYRSASISRRLEDIIRYKSTLSGLVGKTHDNVVGIFDAGDIFGSPFIVHEPHRGPTCAAGMKGGSLPPERVIEAGIHIACGLAFLHGLGVRHLQINPASVIIADGRWRIIDTGLAHIYEFPEGTERPGIDEVLEYCSPEQIGVIKRSVDERSDLFSLGALLYRLLAGAGPFAGRDVCGIMYAQIALDRGSSLPGTSGIPALLSDIILKLLAKDPENRYQSAAGLLGDLRRLQDGAGGFIPGLNDRSSRLSFHSPLIGRARELSRLRAAVDAAGAGRCGVCLLSGEAGDGKSRLIEECRQYAFMKGLAPLYARCFEDFENVPYRPTVDLMNSYHAAFNTYPEERRSSIRSSLHDRFLDLGEILLALNPVMGDVVGSVKKLQRLDGEEENARFHSVLADFFIALCAVEKGVALFLDDVQWLDAGTLNVLDGCLAAAGAAPLLVVCAYRGGSPPPVPGSMPSWGPRGVAGPRWKRFFSARSGPGKRRAWSRASCTSLPGKWRKSAAWCIRGARGTSCSRYHSSAS